MHPLKCSFMDSRRNIKNVSAITCLWRRLHSWKPVCSPLWRTEGAQCVLPRSQQFLLLSSKTLYHLLCNHLQENKSHDVSLTVEKLWKVNLSHFTGCIFISLREIRTPGSCNWFRVSLMNHTDPVSADCMRCESSWGCVSVQTDRLIPNAWDPCPPTVLWQHGQPNTSSRLMKLD